MQGDNWVKKMRNVNVDCRATRDEPKETWDVVI